MRLHLKTVSRSKSLVGKGSLTLLAAGMLLCVQVLFYAHTLGHLSDLDEEHNPLGYCELCLSSLALDAASDSSTHPIFSSKAFALYWQLLADQIRQRLILPYSVRAPPLR